MNYFNNISYFISHIFLMLFIYNFITHRYSKNTTKLICLSSCILLTITDFLKLNLFPDSGLCYVIVTLMQILLTQFTGIFISKKRNSKVLFIGLSASNYVIIGSVLAIILFIYTQNKLIALTGSIIIHAAILSLLYCTIRDIWIKEYEIEYTKGWWKLCLIPVFFYCSFFCIAFFPHTLYNNPDNILGILCFIVTMLVSYVVVLQYIENDAKQKNIYLKNVLFEAYIKGLENQYYIVEQAEQNLKILRHDMRHYCNMISYLLNHEEYEEIHNILSYISSVTDENKVVKYCNNLIANTIISKMIDKATSLNVNVNLDIIIDKNIPVNNYEFTAVIANLFENALDSVKNFDSAQRFIDIKIHCTENKLIIRIKNPYNDKILFDKNTGLPKSKGGSNHGFGMQSILAFSEKINGTIDCFCKDNFFYIIMYAKF